MDNNAKLLAEMEELRNENIRLKNDIEELKAQVKELKDEVEDKYISRHAQLMRDLAQPAGGGVLPQRSMTTGISRDDEEADGAASAAAAGGGPSVARSVSSHGVSTDARWIVKEIPALYPAYNCSAGSIGYWKELPDGSGWEWEPTVEGPELD